jgi:hypothetical protein
MRSVDDKTRDSYVAMRNSGNYDAVWFYRYFLDNGGKDTGIEYFISVLNMYGIDGVIDSLDKKFGVVKLEDKSGKFIKIIQ